jgi:hypothetical protein
MVSEYLGVCAQRHRSYLRLTGVTADTRGRCPACGGPADLYPLPPVKESPWDHMSGATPIRSIDEPLPPPSAMDRATMRAMAHWGTDRAHAEDIVKHTLLGQQMLLHEQTRDLGRAIAKATPVQQALALIHALLDRFASRSRST